MNKSKHQHNSLRGKRRVSKVAAQSRIVLAIVLMVSASCNVFGQQAKDTAAHRQYPYIESMDTLINIKASLNNDFERFENKGKDFRFDVRPNIALVMRLSFNYSLASFSYSYSPNFLPGNNDNKEKGKTRSHAFATTLHFGHWIQDIQYSKITGFYLANSADVIPDWKKEDGYLLIPDLKVKTYRGITAYKFNPNFSTKAILSQLEIQRRSCGSFIPFLTYNYTIVDNKSKGSTDQTSSQRSDTFQMIAVASYQHTFVIYHRFYISLMAGLGGGIGYIKLLSRLPEGKTTTHSYHEALYAQAAVNVGYNGPKVFCGISSNAIVNEQTQTGQIHLDRSRGYYHFHIGYRLTAPKLLKRSRAWVESQYQPKK